MWHIRRSDFEAMMLDDPELAVAVYRGIVQVLCQRLRDTTEGISVLLEALDEGD
jgi:hypothetical protein